VLYPQPMLTTWTTDDHLVALDRAGEFLISEPVRHNLLLTVLTTNHPPATFVGVEDGGSTVGLARFDHGLDRVALSTMGPAAARALVPTLARCSSSARVFGNADVVATVIAEWTELAALAAEPVRSMRLYQCPTVRLPAPFPPGSFRLATPDDTEVLAAFCAAFDREIDEHRTSEQIDAYFESRVTAGTLFLWEHEDTVVSMSTVTEAVSGVRRVQNVYTPPEQRGRGYAAANVGTATQRLLDAGNQVILYADLTNATSNGVYERLGYTAVTDELVFQLQTA